MVRETRFQSQVESYQRFKNAPLLNSLQCKVWIKGKWSNPKKSVEPSQHVSVVPAEKGAFRSAFIAVGQLTNSIYCLILIIQFNICHLFTHREVLSSMVNDLIVLFDT